MRWMVLVALCACSDTSLKVVSTPPTAQILLPTDGDTFVAERDTLTLHGQVGDEEQSPDSLTVIWLSNQDGEIASLGADSTGLTVVELGAESLSLGAHTITLSVSDTDGLNDSDKVSVEILPADAPPEVSVTAPEDGASFDFGEVVTFVGQATDARTASSDLAYEWELDGGEVLDAGNLSSDGNTSFSTAELSEGDHAVLLRVTDADGYAAEASVSVTINHVNEPPEVSVLSPASGSGEKVGQRVTFEGLATDLEDEEPALGAVWSSDLDGALCSGAPDSAGTSACSTTALSVGLHTITLTATDTAGESAYASVLFEVYERNTPPGTPTIEIVPSDPSTDDGLEVVVLTDATDDDGDAVTYNYQWYKDSALMSGYTLATVAATHTSKGEVWMVEVTATDGEDEGAPATASVTVLNSPPSISGVSLSPSAPTTVDTITCTPSGWSDADDDAEGYRYAWTVNGSAVSGDSATLAGAFRKNQRVVCTVTPWDGEEEGDPVSSSAVTVVNSPPEAPEIAIDPTYPVTTDDLVVVDSVSAYDADGDTLTTTYVWKKNGAVVSGRTTDTVPASATTLEETWSVTVTVDDGDDSASSAEASARIWPDDGDLLVTEFMPDPDAVSDQRGEWLELYNNTSIDINLDDHSVEDLDYDIADLSGLTLGAGEFFVLCVEEDPTQNGGVACDLEVRRPSYGTCSGTDCMLLGNSDDEIIILNPAGTVDQVVYAASWVSPGEATGLDPDEFDEISNDSKASWCAQSTAIESGGDKGTPGGDNDGC